MDMIKNTLCNGINKKFVLVLYLTLFFSTVVHAMLKEVLWDLKDIVREAISYPRLAACICAAKTVPTCKARTTCPQLFVSPLKHRDTTSPKQLRYVRLFSKQSFLKVNKVGGVGFYYDPDNSGKIQNIFLNEDYRGKGLGYILLQHALHEMDENNVQRVTLSVGDWNQCAIGLYKKSNFFVHEKVDGGAVMVRLLPSQDDQCGDAQQKI